MKLEMIGIDYEKAPIAVREKFSFTKAKITELLEDIKTDESIKGCVIMNTCNRMEMYFSNPVATGMYNKICEARGLDPKEFEEYVSYRKDRDLVEHLFTLGSGLKSMIVGEDQILAQVKDARSLASESGVIDPTLDNLFQKATAVGKKVRSEIVFDHNNRSASDAAVSMLVDRGYDLKGKIAVCIGNGEMGKLAAEALVAQGAEVYVTVRQYRSGVVMIPEGTQRINYADRYEYIKNADYIFSATASPNLTLTAPEVEVVKADKQQVFVDLAVPRDIDSKIAEIPNAVLYGIDDLSVGRTSERMDSQKNQAMAIIDEKVDEFMNWFTTKDLVPRIRNVSTGAAKDAAWRISRVYKDIDLEDGEKELLEKTIQDAVSKSVSKLLFDLRDNVDANTLKRCLETWENE